MNKEFLKHYNQELAYVQRLGTEFAKLHPKIAGNLRMTEDTIEDPHVSRLIQAVAFLNAGIREKLDDDYPELSSALLNVLYPHYLAPIPSMAIVQFQADKSSSAEAIPKGRLIETLPVNNVPIRFSTCYDTTAWPIQITQAKLYDHTQLAPLVPEHRLYSSVLELELKTTNPSIALADLAPDMLRFFLKGATQQSFGLYELLLRNTGLIALAHSAKDTKPVWLSAQHIKAVGLTPDEGMLPYSNRSHVAYRLLTEFFTFPEKFLFFELHGLTANNLAQFGDTVKIYFYLKQSKKELEQYIDADYFALGCTPVVNLFPKTTNPINWDHTQPSYKVNPDSNRPEHFEVYSINDVSAVHLDGSSETFLPFYGIKHDTREHNRYWLARRRLEEFSSRDEGTFLDLSLIDLDMKPSELKDWVISVSTTCTNRDLPAQLPFGGGEPYLQFTEGGSGINKIVCLTAPTPTRRLGLGGKLEWRLLAHLSLNHLSLMDEKEAVDNLREMLRLYDYTDSDESRLLIDSIENLTTRRVMARDPSGHLNAFCQGIEVHLELDENKFTGSSLYLFGSILDRFFGLYCSINSFTKLTVFNKHKRKVLQQWPARSGEKTLI